MKKERKFSVLTYVKLLFLLLGLILLLTACTVNEAGEKSENSRMTCLLPAGGSRASNASAFSRIEPAVTVQSSYDAETLRLQVELQSYTENIRKRYERAGMDVIEVSVMGGEVGLRRADDSGKSFISIHNGLEEDFAELLGRKVSLKIQSFSNHYVVAFRLSVWETEGASEICFPVTFYLEKTVKNTEAITDTYQFYGSLQYKVTVRTPQKGTTSFLIQPEKVSRSIVLPM